MKMNYYLYRYLWPIYRILVKHKLSKRCAICALNENCVRIHDSVCEICREEHTSKLATQAAEFNNNPVAEKELDKLLTEAQGKGRGLYDAMFLFSGGKDSTYILNRLKTRYKPLRLVALTVDNGFRSPIGKQNAERICEHLDVDHLEIRPYQIFKKLYKYGFENFSHHGFVCTDFWEGELFQDIGRNLAAQLDIPLLILGYTPEQVEEAFLPKEFDEYHLYGSEDFQFKDNQKFTRTKFLGVNLTDIFTPEEMNYWWDASKWSVEKIPTLILPFQAWGYHKTEVVNEVVSLLHHILDEKSMNPMLTNDLYSGLGLFLDYKIFGYSPMFEQEFARYVRTGKEDIKQNRNLWESAEYLFLRHEKSVLDSPDIQFCLTKLGLTKPALDTLIKKSKARLEGKQ
jgi:hypothetical protein